MKNKRGKIIYLGFQKCGTTSFWFYCKKHGLKGIHNTLRACDAMGLDRHPNHAQSIEDLIDYNLFNQFVDRFDVLTDNPFPLLYEYLDRTFENPRFVLGTRPSQLWLSSMQRYFNRKMPALGHAIYATEGNPISDPCSLVEVYDRHNEAVRRYFDGRSDFIEIRLGTDNDEEITDTLENFLALPRDSGIKFGKKRPDH